MDVVSLIISLVSGLVGGNVAGAASKENSLGAIGNSVAGLIGGGAGGYILQALELYNKMGGPAITGAAAAPGATGMDIGSILANVGTSGVSGAVLMLIAGVIKNYMNKA